MADTPLGVDVTIVRRRTLPSIVPARQGKMDILTVYKTSAGQTGSVWTPAEGDSEAALVSAIRADIKEHAQWQSKTLKV